MRIGDLPVTIKPKVKISLLVFLLGCGCARDPGFWRNESVLLDDEPYLAEALRTPSPRCRGGRWSRGCSGVPNRRRILHRAAWTHPGGPT